jgi:hypothetical protein
MTKPFDPAAASQRHVQGKSFTQLRASLLAWAQLQAQKEASKAPPRRPEEGGRS